MKFELKLLTIAVFALTASLINCANDEKIKYCNDGLGQCVTMDRCKKSDDFHRGEGLFNIRFNLDEDEEKCHYLEICCHEDDVVEAVKETVIPAIWLQPIVETTTFEPHSLGGAPGGDTKPDSSENNKPHTSGSSSDEDKGTNEVHETTHAPDHSEGHETTHAPNHSEEHETLKPSSIDDRLHENDQTEGDDSHSTPKPPADHNDDCNDGEHQCVPYFFCNEDHTTDGAGAFTMRFAQSCSDKSHVCCHKKNNILNYRPQKCGIHNVKGVGFTVTNQVDEAQFGEFPWMAALLETTFDHTDKYFCGGSLIDPHVILTAAHCVHGKNAASIKVRLGEWDTQTDKEILHHSDHEVSEIVMHSDFNENNLMNDVALLVLKNPATLKIHINTVCLPSKNTKVTGEAFASGWGVDRFGDATSHRVNLKKLTLPVMKKGECQENLKTTKLGPKFRLHETFMCAGGERDVDTCTGDGGSPLVVPVPGLVDIYHQVGIVAWGMECGQENIPGVYGDVVRFREWIDEKMNGFGFGTKSYTSE